MGEFFVFPIVFNDDQVKNKGCLVLCDCRKKMLGKGVWKGLYQKREGRVPGRDRAIEVWTLRELGPPSLTTKKGKIASHI